MKKETVKIFVEENQEFSLDGTFLAFGEKCENVIENFKKGEITLVILYNPEKAALNSQKAAFYLKGKLHFAGSKEEVIRKYRFLLDMEKRNEELRKKNREVLEKIKKEGGEIEDIKVIDRENKERYILLKNQNFKVRIEFSSPEEREVRITFFRRDPLLNQKEKVTDIFEKTREKKVEMDIPLFALDKGKMLFEVFVKHGRERKYGDFKIEVESF